MALAAAVALCAQANHKKTALFF